MVSGLYSGPMESQVESRLGEEEKKRGPSSFLSASQATSHSTIRCVQCLQKCDMRRHKCDNIRSMQREERAPERCTHKHSRPECSIQEHKCPQCKRVSEEQVI